MLKKKEIGNKVKLIDPLGNELEIKLMTGIDKVLLWEVTKILEVKYGNLDKNFIDFIYEEGNTFKIVIRDPILNGIVYPAPPALAVLPPPPVAPINVEQPEVVYVSSNSGDSGDINAEAENVSYTFEKKMTAIGSRGGQTLVSNILFNI